MKTLLCSLLCCLLVAGCGGKPSRRAYTTDIPRGTICKMESLSARDGAFMSYVKDGTEYFCLVANNPTVCQEAAVGKEFRYEGNNLFAFLR